MPAGSLQSLPSHLLPSPLPSIPARPVSFRAQSLASSEVPGGNGFARPAVLLGKVPGSLHCLSLLHCSAFSCLLSFLASQVNAPCGFCIDVTFIFIDLFFCSFHVSFLAMPSCVSPLPAPALPSPASCFPCTHEDCFPCSVPLPLLSTAFLPLGQVRRCGQEWG